MILTASTAMAMAMLANGARNFVKLHQRELRDPPLSGELRTAKVDVTQGLVAELIRSRQAAIRTMTAVEINSRAIYGRPGFAPRVLYSDSPE